MGILNRRNAFLGWTAWRIGKRVLKKKARGAVPGRGGGSRRPTRALILPALAALAGALWFWRRRRGDGDTPPSE